MENPGLKLRLRRLIHSELPIGLPEEEVIQKNLKPLKQHVEKKKRAQEIYYKKSSNIGISPMIRGTQRQPVQQRLGRTVPFNGTNTSMVPPKKRLFKNTTLNNCISRTKLLKCNNYAQLRINKIRERQQQTATLVNGVTTKKIKLRRMLPHTSTPNFRIQVKNNGACTNSLSQNLRHRIILDTDIQVAIKQLQSIYTGEEIVLTQITPIATSISLNDRFGNLS